MSFRVAEVERRFNLLIMEEGRPSRGFWIGEVDQNPKSVLVVLRDFNGLFNGFQWF